MKNYSVNELTTMVNNNLSERCQKIFYVYVNNYNITCLNDISILDMSSLDEKSTHEFFDYLYTLV